MFFLSSAHPVLAYAHHIIPLIADVFVLSERALPEDLFVFPCTLVGKWNATLIIRRKQGVFIPSAGHFEQCPSLLLR